MSDPTQKIAVLGAGSWGTALAALVARHGHPTVLWGRDAAMVDAIDRTHENPRYLPGIALPDSLRATTDLQQTIAGASWILVVVPSHAFTETIKLLAPLRPAGAGIAWATKGFEPGSGRFLHEVARDILGPSVPLAVVTGPSFAKKSPWACRPRSPCTAMTPRLRRWWPMPCTGPLSAPTPAMTWSVPNWVAP